MSLRLALQAVAFLVAGYFLLLALLAMGPIGWAVFVPMLAIGTAQVYRNRRQRVDAGSPPNYCPNCGSAVDRDAFDDRGDEQWDGRHCTDCGAPLGPGADADRDDASDGDRGGRKRNCPDCGAPNDPERSTCDHCDAEL